MLIEKEKMCLSFTLEADTLELKQLFKKKDTVEGLVKEAGFSHNSTSIAIRAPNVLSPTTKAPSMPMDS